MKNKLTLIVLCLINLAFGQSKKEQIALLSDKIDSLEFVNKNLSVELTSSKIIIDSLHSNNQRLSNDILVLSQVNEELQINLLVNSEELDYLNDSISKLNRRITKMELVRIIEKTNPDAVRGDFNGDGDPDILTFETDENCSTIIEFTHYDIPNLDLEFCINKPDNLGDLNHDGKDEIGIIELKDGCWSQYYIWTNTDNGWQYLYSPITIHCNQFEKDMYPIVKDRLTGEIKINYSELSNKNEIVVKTKPLIIKYE